MIILNITQVGSVGGDMMDVHLTNGHILMLDLKPLMRDPRYRALLEDDRILYPHTDGESVYWRDGPRLTLAEIMEIVQKNNKED